MLMLLIMLLMLPSSADFHFRRLLPPLMLFIGFFAITILTSLMLIAAFRRFLIEASRQPYAFDIFRRHFSRRR